MPSNLVVENTSSKSSILSSASSPIQSVYLTFADIFIIIRMREIISLSCGKESNFAQTHFWNFEDESLKYLEKNSQHSHLNP